MSTQVEALESLVSHPGWQLFQQYIEREWGLQGVRYQAELDRALNERNIDHACQIRSGQKVIAALMRWPADELGRLKRQSAPEPEREPVMSRRGGL